MVEYAFGILTNKWKFFHRCNYSTSRSKGLLHIAQFRLLKRWVSARG
jgi:hypothetical protein